MNSQTDQPDVEAEDLDATNESLADQAEAIDQASIPYIVAEVTMLPQNTTDLTGKEAEQMVRLMEFLDDCDDVQKVYTNADIPEDVFTNM